MAPRTQQVANIPSSAGCYRKDNKLMATLSNIARLKPEQASSRLMDVATLAEYLGVSRRFVYSHTAPNCPHPIPHLKLGKFVRFRQAEIDRWLDDQTR